MKNYLALFLLITATLLITGCSQADQPKKSPPPEDTSGLEKNLEILDALPEELADVIVIYEKDGQLMLVKGSDSPQALVDGLEFFYPQLSPDGKHVLFDIENYDEREGYDGKYEGSYYDLWLTNLEDGTSRPFVTEEMLRPAKGLPIGKYLPWLATKGVTWLSSGDKIAFVSYGIAHVFNFDNNDLWIADLNTGEAIEFLPDDMGGNFAFSPDNELLIVANETSISLMNTDGGQRLEVLTYNSFGAEYESSYVPQPVWAPDSSYGLVALLNPESYSPYNHFESLKSADSFEEPGNVEIWKIGRDGSTEKLLNIHWPTVDELMSGIIFSPDRRYMISALQSDLVSEARIINLEGEIIATYNYYSRIFNWSPDSQTLLVSNNDDFTMLLANGKEEAFPYASSPKWISPTAFVVIDQAEDADNTLWLADLDGRAIVIDTGVGNEFDALLID
jgi:hypothetical protein